MKGMGGAEATPAPAGERGLAGSWRQSLGAGLLLGLALGCGWLAHWAPMLYTRLLLYAVAGALAVLGLGFMLSLGDGRGWTGAWQRRIEARFAEAGLPFLAALVVLGLIAVISGNNLLYLVVSGLLAALIVSGLVSTLNLSGMELRFGLPAELFAGQAAPVEFTLTNAKSFWPAYSLTVSAASRRAGAGRAGKRAAELRPVYFAYLPRGGSQSAASEITYPERGRYTTAAFALATRFPFGLMQKRRRFQSQEREPEVLVYPAPARDVDVEAALRRAHTGALRSLRGEGHDLYRIRPHQAGDSARAVHWKASARAGALRVREFADEEAPRLRLRLALAATLAPEEAEKALSLATAWTLACEQAGMWLEFAGENRAPAGHGGAAGLFLPLAPAGRHRRAILDYLALVDPALPPAEPPRAALDASLHEVLINGGGTGPERTD